MPSAQPSTIEFWWLAVGCTLSILALWLADRLLAISEPQCRFSVRLEDVKLKAGDLILTSGNNVVTRMFGRSVWNHVGMIFEDPWTHFLYVWEVQLPAVNTVMAITGDFRATRLSPLVRYVERWCKKGHVAIRRLNQTVDLEKFDAFVKQRWNYNFAFDFMAHGANRFFESWWSIPIHRGTHKARYCAELVAETYEHLGVLNSMSSHSTIPGDFAETADTLPFSAGYDLGPEILIEAPPHVTSKQEPINWSTLFPTLYP